MTGTVIGDTYRVMESLGAGGMAQVYKVVHMRAKQVYALKILKAEFAGDAEFLRRFEREAMACLSLQHENIVRAYGMGQFEGRPYIVMEYVEGETLKERVQRTGALPPHKAIAVGCQLLDALAVAHGSGIIHRDIKPQNIILTKRGKVKLTDFGIARELNNSTRTYAGGNVIGSAHYMPPEQARGEQVDAAGDLYSLGVTLYETVTGRVPFSGETAVAIALQHLQTNPMPPQAVNDEIPAALSDVILRALAKKAAHRYPDCATMRADLVRALTDPQGDFVFAKEKHAAPRDRKNTTYYWLFGALGLPIFALLLYFIFYRSICAVPTPPEPPTPTPTLTAAPVTPEPTIPPERPAMPEVLGLPLADALRKLYDAGFTVLISSPLIDENIENPGTILGQSLAPGVRTNADTPITLTVARAAPSKYFADLSFTADIPHNGCEVRLVYETATEDGVPYIVLAYSEIRDREEGALIVARVRSIDAATRTIYLYIDGVLVASKDVKFSD
ncbi:MAG: protein kinase [Clostridiales bacterium]|nr:protein kinase [Clostridiales bacterium]